MKTVLLLVLYIFVLAGCHKIETVSGEGLTHNCYVWNRQYSTSLNENINKYKNVIERYSVLAVEIKWLNGRGQAAIADIPHLNSSINSISIRINDCNGDIYTKKEFLEKQTQAALKRFQYSGFTINEIQFDFDCPESKLKSYGELLKYIKSAFSQKITITALPSWLNAKSLAGVLAHCDHYVLQLHSLKKPQGLMSIPDLFDFEKADKWLNQAAEHGVDFSISLPTYGYFLGFDERGNYLGVSSEQGPKNWPETKVLLSSYKDLSKFVGKLKRKRPALLRSIYWFRMNHNKDELNWDFKAVKKLIEGEVLEDQGIRIVSKKTESGAIDLIIENTAYFPQLVPAQIHLNATAGNIQVFETYRGFNYEQGEHGVYIQNNGALVIAPGRKIPVGWYRLENKNGEELTYDF